MKKIYIVWGFLIVLLLGLVAVFGMSYNKEYKNLESTIEDVVAKYLGEHLNEYPTSGKAKIEITDVIKNDYSLSLEVEDDKCEGYVIVSTASVGYKYEAFIKCNNYITKGYEE